MFQSSNKSSSISNSWNQERDLSNPNTDFGIGDHSCQAGPRLQVTSYMERGKKLPKG